MSDTISFKAINNALTTRRNIPSRSPSPLEQHWPIMSNPMSASSNLRKMRYKNLINGRRARGVEAGFKHLSSNFVFKRMPAADQQRFQAVFESRVRARFANLINIPIDDLPAGADTGRQIAKGMLVEYVTLRRGEEIKQAERAAEWANRAEETEETEEAGEAGEAGEAAGEATAASESDSDSSVGGCDPSSPAAAAVATAARAVIKSKAIPLGSPSSPRPVDTADPTGTSPRRLLWMQLCTDDAMMPIAGLRRAWAGEEAFLEALARAEAALKEAARILRGLERMGGLEGLGE